MKIYDLIIKVLAHLTPLQIVVGSVCFIVILWSKARISEWQKDKQDNRRKTDIEWIIKQGKNVP